jgi:hypothetical protein
MLWTLSDFSGGSRRNVAALGRPTSRGTARLRSDHVTAGGRLSVGNAHARFMMLKRRLHAGAA